MAELIGIYHAYPHEGDFDTPLGPPTCWRSSVALGHVSAPSSPRPLWGRYLELGTAALTAGLSGIRLTPEWARLADRPGRYDLDVVEHYRREIRDLRHSGLSVHVAVIDDVWPSFLGGEGWLWPWAHDALVDHVAALVEMLGDDVTSWDIAPEVDGIIRDGFITGQRPPFRKSAGRDAQEVRDMWRETLSQCDTHIARTELTVIPVTTRTADVAQTLATRGPVAIDALLSDNSRDGLCVLNSDGVSVRQLLA